MRECDRHLRHEGEWIERVHARGMRQVLDRNVWLAEIDSHPPAEMPRLGKVRIEQESTIDEGGADFHVMGDIGKRKPSPGERDGVIPAQLRSTAGQPSSFGRLLRVVRHPTTCLARNVTPRSHAISRGELGVELDSLVEEPQRFRVALFRPRMNARYPAQKIVVGIEALSRLVLRT